VPLKRVSQAYVIATSKVVKVTPASFESVSDDLFSKKESTRGRRTASANLKGAEAFFEAREKKTVTEESRKALQKAVDDGVTLDATTTKYLSASSRHGASSIAPPPPFPARAPAGAFAAILTP
jgi:hypothetical protein